MMDAKLDRGGRTMIVSVKNLNKATNHGLRQGFFQLGTALKKEANKQILHKPKNGRIYKIHRGDREFFHKASARGETAANLDGHYRKTVGFKIKGSSKMIFGAGSANVPYAEWLENGTEIMAPRPGLRNTIEEKEKDAERYFADGIKQSIKSGK